VTGTSSDGDAQRLGEQQELDVEYPCREVLARKERAGGGAREQLEPALGVAHVADARDAKHGVQAVHEEVAQDGPLRAFLGVRTHWCTSERAQGMLEGKATHLNDRIRLDEVSTAANRDCGPRRSPRAQGRPALRAAARRPRSG
jgi:hypothetical protein